MYRILFSVLLMSPIVWADEAGSIVPCADEQLSKTDFRVATVKSGLTPRVYFFYQNSGYYASCPEEDSFCLTKKYLIPSDEVLVGQEQGNMVCAFYPNKAYGTDGWLEKSALAFKAINKTPSLKSWVGHWKYAHNTIDISSMVGNTLSVGGEALWFGGKQSNGYQSIHDGSLGGEIKPINNSASLDRSDDDGCSAKFVLVNQYLIISDNGQCGGMNVRFDGIYTKR